jgi:dTMP kinase
MHNFVILEGGDGTGTSTQLTLLKQRSVLAGNGFPFHSTFEPTENPIGRLIRSALRKEPELLPQTIARLFSADRAEHLYGPGGIQELCADNRLVVCDRYVPSSLVYQGLECGNELPQALNRDFPRPEMILYFEIDPQTAAERFSRRSVKDVYERLDFQVRVHQGYERVLPMYCSRDGNGEEVRLIRIDAEKTIEEVAEQVWSALKSLPILGA